MPMSHRKQYTFFCHKDCEYFPCHHTEAPEDFNCLFCYCPLYTLGSGCGGNYHYTDKGVKDCSHCLLPHRRENYSYVIGKFEQIKELAAKGRKRSEHMEKNYRAELTGVFGDPVDGNPTGIMEEAGYKALGLNYRYITMRVKPGDLKAAFEGAKAIGMKGVNLTMPHKIKIIPYLDRLTEAAQIIGAVNTVVYDDGIWLGENTDGKGFVLSLELEGISPAGKEITILGAGGAARAIAVECALAGAKQLHIINRDQTRGRELAALINNKTNAAADYISWEPCQKLPGGTEILIQATSIGLHPNMEEKPDIDYTAITDSMVVCDVVFNPIMPLFLQEAQKLGARIITGIGMLVQQGAINFRLWTGEDAPVDVMYKTLEQEFL